MTSSRDTSSFVSPESQSGLWLGQSLVQLSPSRSERSVAIQSGFRPAAWLLDTRVGWFADFLASWGGHLSLWSPSSLKKVNRLSFLTVRLRAFLSSL